MRARGSRGVSTPRSNNNVNRKRTISKSTPTPESLEKDTPKTKKLRRVRISTSPESNVESRGGSVAPSITAPAEYYSFEYRVGSALERCPHITNLLDTDPDDIDLREDLFSGVQYELEQMLSHGADFLRQLHGEIQFLNTGEYPTTDLRKRPRPIYSMRNRVEASQSDDSDIEMDAPIVPPEPEDDIDAWPPASVPLRFWTWCKFNYLKPIDTDFMLEFQTYFIDAYSEEEMKDLLVNEPWKHRVRRKKSRPSKNSLKKRRSKAEKMSPIKCDIDIKEESHFDHIELTDSASPKHSGSNYSDYYIDEISQMPVFGKVPYALLKKMIDAFLAERDQEEKEHKDNYALEIDISLCDSAKSESQISNDFDDQDEDDIDGEDMWENEDHKENINLEPGTINTDNYQSVLTPPGHELNENLVETIMDDAIRTLVPTDNIVPEVIQEFHRLNEESVPVGVSDEGRQPGEAMDEISTELLRLQRKLRRELSSYGRIASGVHESLKDEYAANMIRNQLNKADEELIRLGGKCYREPPLPRRVANTVDMAVLNRAKNARIKKAKAYYEDKYLEPQWEGVMLKPTPPMWESKLPWPIEEIRNAY